MNNARRAEIRRAYALCLDAQELLERAQGIVQTAIDEEEAAIEALPESLQTGAKARAMEDCKDGLESLASALMGDTEEWTDAAVWGDALGESL